jgi:hypothetical protein
MVTTVGVLAEQGEGRTGDIVDAPEVAGLHLLLGEALHAGGEFRWL